MTQYLIANGGLTEVDSIVDVRVEKHTERSGKLIVTCGANDQHEVIIDLPHLYDMELMWHAMCHGVELIGSLLARGVSVINLNEVRRRVRLFAFTGMGKNPHTGKDLTKAEQQFYNNEHRDSISIA